MPDSTGSGFLHDMLPIFVAVVLAELAVLAAQAAWPFLAERVRIQQEAWNTPLGRADQALSGGSATPNGG